MKFLGHNFRIDPTIKGPASIAMHKTGALIVKEAKTRFTKRNGAMPRRTVSKRAIKSLESIIGRLERWQHQFPTADPEDNASRAKSELMRLLRESEHRHEQRQ